MVGIDIMNAKRPDPLGIRAFQWVAGDGLLSHRFSAAVPSALQVLTTVFGMGTGVAPAR